MHDRTHTHTRITATQHNTQSLESKLLLIWSILHHTHTAVDINAHAQRIRTQLNYCTSMKDIYCMSATNTDSPMCWAYFLTYIYMCVFFLFYSYYYSVEFFFFFFLCVLSLTLQSQCGAARNLRMCSTAARF